MGIIIDGDLWCVLEWGGDVCILMVWEMMTVGLCMVELVVLVVVVLVKMSECKITSLLVVEGECLVGLLYIYDVLYVGIW